MLPQNNTLIYICILLCCYVQLNAYAAIHEDWMDDYLVGPMGWRLSKQTDAATSRSINDTITNNINISYHGPYEIGYVYWLSRQFYCQHYSHLNISYKIIYNQKNYVKLYINNQMYRNNYVNDSYDYALNTYSPVYQANCSESFVSIVYQENIQSFELKFEMKSTGNNSNGMIAIDDIKIDCIPLEFLFIIKIRIIFEYEIIDRDTTLHQIQYKFANITKTLLNQYGNNNNYKCVKSNDYNITVNNEHSFTNITANILVCDMETEQLVSQDLNDNLLQNLIEKLLVLKNENILTVDLDTINLNVFSINYWNDMSSTMYSTSMNMNEHPKSLYDGEWIILYPVISVILLCIAGCCIYLKYKMKRNEEKQRRKKMKTVNERDNSGNIITHAMNMETINEDEETDNDNGDCVVGSDILSNAATIATQSLLNNDLNLSEQGNFSVQ